MKKMIDQEKINKSDALFEGMTADANGNVTIGKNLEVDGTLTLNDATDVLFKNGGGIGKAKLDIDINTNTEVFTKEIYDKIANGDIVLNLNKSNENRLYGQATYKRSANGYAATIPYFEIINDTQLHWSFYQPIAKFKPTGTDYTIEQEYRYATFAEEPIEGACGNFFVSYSWKIGAHGSKHIYYLIKPKQTDNNKFLKASSTSPYFQWEEMPKYFNHDVQIMFNNSPLFLSIITTSNTPIDSVTDLKTACGSRTRIPMSGGFPGTGSVIQFACAYLPQENKLQLYSGNTTTVGGTTVLLATGDGNTLGAITDDITTI